MRSAELAGPGPGEGGVRVRCAGVNFIDVYHRTGLYPRELPFVPGLEGSGEVEAVGPEVTAVATGDRVAWADVAGSYATRLLAPAERLVPIPAGVTDAQAAAVMLQGMTAHYLVHGVRATDADDVALVHAAAGGVGLLLTQMLRAAGAQVVATCSSPDKARLASGAGAARVLGYDEDFVAEARDLSDGRGADVVYDSVGQATIDASIDALRPRGLLVSFGQSSGPVPPLDVGRLARAGSLFLTRPSLFHYIADRAELIARADAVLGAVAGGELEVRIGLELPLSEAETAQRALEGRKTTGKVLLAAG